MNVKHLCKPTSEALINFATILVVFIAPLIFPKYKLGNMTEVSLCELMYSDRQQRFGEAKQANLPEKCRRCPYLFACNGECPKNRFAETENGDWGLNYLCEGYYRFFEHIKSYMDFMANAYRNRQAPAQVMRAIKEGLL